MDDILYLLKSSSLNSYKCSKSVDFMEPKTSKTSSEHVKNFEG